MKLKKVVLVWALALLGGLAWVTLAQAQPPDDLGKAIAANYLDALKKVNELMKARPEPTDLSPKMAALKEETIKKMVEVGQKVAKLNDAGKKKVDAKVSMALGSTPQDLFKAFSEGQQFYAKKDDNLGKTIKDFNIITQYALFDLLKKQEPKEAERLGIK
jgi:hypothetical protein